MCVCVSPFISPIILTRELYSLGHASTHVIGERAWLEFSSKPSFANRRSLNIWLLIPDHSPTKLHHEYGHVQLFCPNERGETV